MAYEMKCSRCEKVLTNEKGIKCAGLELTISYDGMDDEMKRLMENSMGRYKGGIYAFCYECLLGLLLGY